MPKRPSLKVQAAVLRDDAGRAVTGSRVARDAPAPLQKHCMKKPKASLVSAPVPASGAGAGNDDTKSTKAHTTKHGSAAPPRAVPDAAPCAEPSDGPSEGSSDGLGSAILAQLRRRHEARAARGEAPVLPDNVSVEPGRRLTSEGWPVFTPEELKLGLKGSGNTPLCPFDCDCCF